MILTWLEVCCGYDSSSGFLLAWTTIVFDTFSVLFKPLHRNYVRNYQPALPAEAGSVITLNWRRALALASSVSTSESVLSESCAAVAVLESAALERGAGGALGPERAKGSTGATDGGSVARG